MLEWLKLARRILVSDTSRVPVSKKDLLILSLKLGLENLYIGERYNHASKGVVICNMDGRRIVPDVAAGKKTLFRHKKGDYYYYDILDRDTRCEKLCPEEEFFYVQCGCANLEKVEDIIQEKGKVYQRRKIYDTKTKRM